jgi:Raf kinase inhibitor-like YbhB/YbcL family protein
MFAETQRTRDTSFATALLLAIGTSCAACNGCQSSSGHPSSPPGVTLATMTVTSKAFPANGAIPVDYSCDGTDHSPPLVWSAPPEGTRALAVVVDDPDAPGGDFTHWLAYDIAPTTLTLPEGVDVASLGGAEGTNGFGRPGYGGPCPPRREMHRYFFHVFALSAPLGLKPGANRDAVDGAMAQRVLGEGSLMGTFGH